MFILDRIYRELHSLKCLDLKFGSSSEFSNFFNKIPVRIILDVLLCAQVFWSVFLCPDIFIHSILKLRRNLDSETARMVVFVFMFVVISTLSFVLILVRIILNVSLLKSLNPAQSLSSFLPGTDHQNHLLTSFQTLRKLLIKLTLKTWSYILWVT